MIQRTPLLLERSQHSYGSAKERSFRGGKFNIHRGSRLMDRKPDKTIEQGPKRDRAGDDLKDEPTGHARTRAEPIRRPIGSSLHLIRSKLLIDDHAPS